MKRWALRHHGYCPFCEEEDEDVEHIIKCLHEDATRINHDALWELTKELIKIGTCPCAVREIRNEIEAWRNNLLLPTLSNMNESLQDTILAQRKIGWKSFIEGLFTKKWRQYQQEYFTEIESKKGHNLWTSKAIRACWKYI